MSAENFIDSNIVVYLFDEVNLDKYRRADALVRENLDNRTGCISYQVVQETLNVVGRMVGAGSERLSRLLEEILIPLWEINRILPNPELYRSGLRVQARYGFSFTTRSWWPRPWKRAAPPSTARICRTASRYRD